LLALLAGLGLLLLPPAAAVGLSGRTGLMGLCFGLLCWVCFERPKAWLAAGFSWTPLRWLGNMSYSFYLLHGLALKAGFLLLARLAPPSERGGLWFGGWLLPMFALALLTSVVLYLLIELPYSLPPTLKSGGPARAAPTDGVAAG
jgi:exopolysaccharide production protein ExoZ